MSINIWTDSMQHAALLGKPVLFTNWLIQRDIIPDGWYCYDLRGTHKSPSTRTTLVDHAADYHAGTVLSPIPLKHEGTASRRVNGTFYLLGEEMTLEQFCEEHDLAYPQDNREFVLRPASLDEVGLFYSEEKLDEALGTVGHLRMDFGHGEKEFWHTWWPHIPKDVITAIRWLTAAAKQENGYAEYVLALVYLTGEDAPKDSVKALSLLKRSAGRGNQFAQYRLGKLLLQGEDAPKDVKAAIRWLTAAAEQGNQYAQYALGKLYLLGKEVPKDRSSAIKWFQLAADQGNEYAQYFLKHMDDRLGQPPVAAVISLFHHLANIFQEQNQPPPSGGVRVAVDRKLLRKIKAKKIAQGHKADDHEPEMQL